jgi:hypothetical protein
VVQALKKERHWFRLPEPFTFYLVLVSLPNKKAFTRMDTTELLLTKNLQSLLETLRNGKESKETKMRAILDFHFIQTEQVKYLLEDLEEDKQATPSHNGKRVLLSGIQLLDK